MGNTARACRNRPLEVEPLESMTLLSGLTMLGAAPVEHPVTVAAASQVRVELRGTTRGDYTSEARIPDVGTSYTVFSMGRLARFGPAVVTGNLHSLGFISSGHAPGTLRVVLARGTLTLNLTGPTQPGFSPLPSQFSFVITSGTGRFHNAVGSGTVDVTLKPDASSSSPTQGHGRITLVFHPGAAMTV
jgi:hypothetical protein